MQLDRALNRGTGQPEVAGSSVLVLDGQTRQALSTARSLGQAGVRVDVGVTDGAPPAAAAASRWCAARVTLPPAEVGTAALGDAIVAALDQRRADVLLPCYDGSIEAVRERRDEIARRASIALAPEAALRVAVDKPATLAVATALGIVVPRSLPVADPADLTPAAAEIGWPAVLKPDRSWTGHRFASLAVSSLAELHEAYELMVPEGAAASLQEWLPGRRDAVTLLVVGSEVTVAFAQTSHRELPPLGGASVLAESLPPLDELVGPAGRLALEIGLEGCSMVEFRRNASGVPVLMEVNPRMPGSIALAVGCGIDLPVLVQAWALGREVPRVERYTAGRRMHWALGDVWSLYSVLNGDHGPDVPRRRAALRAFATELVRRSDVAAVFDPHDVAPALAEARALLLAPLAERLRRGVRRTSPHPPGGPT